MKARTDAALRAARELLALGEAARARDVLDEALARDGAEPRAWLLRAAAAGSPEEARACVARAEALAPGDPVVARARAWVGGSPLGVEDPLVGTEDPLLGSATADAQGRAGLRGRGSFWDVGLTAASAVALYWAVVLAEAGASLGPLQWALGLAWVLAVPGYWLTLALFPSVEDLDGPERAGLALGLSVAWAPVLALVLDRLPWGIRLWPILVGQVASVALFAGLALWRQGRLPAGAATAPGPPRPRAWWRALPAADRRVYGVVAAALLVGAAAAAYVFLVPSPDEFYTEFYVLGAEGLAEDYPRQAAVGEALAVTLGITNRERERLTYQVEVWAVDPWSDGQHRVGTAGPVALAPGETWEAPVTWQMPQAGEDQQVQFLLFRAGDVAPYRQLRLWLDVGEAGR